MNEVSRQGFINSISGYIGIVLGYINLVLILPYWFDKEQVGLIIVLGAASGVFGQIGQLGIVNIAIRYFPQFRDKANKHNGFNTFILAVPLLGYLLVMLLAFLFKEPIFNYYQNESPLFTDNFGYVLFMGFFLMYFDVLDAYLRALYKTVVPYTLRNVILRLLWFGAYLAFHLGCVDFDTFLKIYVNGYGVGILLMLLYLYSLGELKLSFSFKKFNGTLLKGMASYGLFSILNSSAAFLNKRIDIFMVAARGLTETAVYGVAFSIGSAIAVPFNSVMRIATSVISDFWERDDMIALKKLYKSTSNNQLALSLWIYLGIVLNIDNVFKILPEEYADGKWVILIIGLMKVIDVSMGFGALIIQYSKYYKVSFYANVLLVVLTILTNLYFIPLYGIMGAAIASLISILVRNIYQTSFVWYKINMQPFGWKSLLTIVFATGSYLLVNLIPEQQLLVDIAIRSVTVSIIYGLLVYNFKISLKLNGTIKKLLAKIGIKI